MRVSLNTIRTYIDFELPPVEELVQRINRQLGGVEEVIDFREKYAGPVIVRVVECIPHPDSDHMHVCKIDDGHAVDQVDRDENGYVQVVCGAPNVREGLTVAWLPPQSTVPASFDEAERFVLGSRNLRGVVSHGMLASPRELALGDDHNGILEIDPEEFKPIDIEIRPGLKLAEAYGLDDVVIDIENKMFTHRPDCFGQLGVAREIAGILERPFTSPDWYLTAPELSSGEGKGLHVFNDAPQKVPRFMAVALRDVTIKQSPLWLRTELVRLGGKPINNIVDVTNYVMLLTAQPTHAYDYDKLAGQMLGVRLANKGEKLTLLNHKTYELDDDDIVIVDGQGPVGLAGVMGGGESEVSDETKNIVLEVATFDMYAVRKTSMRHGVFTDALTRFNKGQSPLQNDRILGLLIRLCHDVSGANQASEVYDQQSPNMGAENHVSVALDEAFINSRLGLDLGRSEIQRLLENVEMKVASETNITVTPPFWRTDIQLPEDIVEEVGRLYGFDKLPRELPHHSISPVRENAIFDLKTKVSQILSSAGANEVKTYSFVHEKILKKAEQDPNDAFRLGNALSPDLQYYRLNVLPSILDKVHGNIKAGHDEFVLYESGKGHDKKRHAHDGDDSLPSEQMYVDMVYASKKPSDDGSAFYHVRHLVDHLAHQLKIDLTYSKLEDSFDLPVAAPFDPRRSAAIYSAEGNLIGTIGELKPSVVRNFKLPIYSAAASLNLEELLNALKNPVRTYKPLSRFPRVTQDLSLRVDADLAYGDLYKAAKNSLAELPDQAEVMVELSPLGIYQPVGSSSKTVTLRFTITNYARTLTDSAAAIYLDHVAAVCQKAFAAERA